MTDTYRGGYKKALLDLRNFVDKEVISDTKSKKQLKTRITSSLDLLLTDPESLDAFMQYGGGCSCRLDVNTQEIKEFFR